MIRSRATATAMSHSGTSFENRQSDEHRASSNLSAIGSRMDPSTLCHPKRLARNPSSASDNGCYRKQSQGRIEPLVHKLTAIGTTNKILISVIRFGR
jgi:hypothetical protein